MEPFPDQCADQFQENPARAFARAQAEALERQVRRKEGRPMSVFERLQRFFGGNDANGSAGAAVPGSSAPSSDGTGVIDVQVPGPAPRLTTSSMTQEQLKARRINIVEAATFGRPFHERVMLFFLRLWLLVGPVAFVALTSSEIAYILTHLVAPGDNATLIIWGGALFIDLAMMFTTFGVALKRRDLADKRDVNGSVSRREEGEVWLGTAMWLVFAVINIIGQSAFLLHIIQSGHGQDSMTLLYIFVASRVTGFILGDAVTAFFLAKVDNSALKLIARGEREKAALYRDIAQAEGERQLIEAKAEAEISLIRIRVQQEQDDARFLAELKAQVFQDILARRANAPELDGPNRSRLRRLDV